MRGGGLIDVPNYKKAFALAAIAGAVLLVLAYVMLQSAQKQICVAEVQGTDPGTISSQLDRLCGLQTKVNTVADRGFVVLQAAGCVLGVTWLLSLLAFLKQWLWDVNKTHDLRRPDGYIMVYASLGAFGALFLYCAYCQVGEGVERTCEHAPSTNCTSQTYNQGRMGYLFTSLLWFSVLAVLGPVWALVSSTEFLKG